MSYEVTPFESDSSRTSPIQEFLSIKPPLEKGTIESALGGLVGAIQIETAIYGDKETIVRVTDPSKDFHAAAVSLKAILNRVMH